MMRLARKAPLLVMFYLLTSAATAYAECAWVVWPTHSRALAGLNLAGLPWAGGIRGRNARRPGSAWLTAGRSCEPMSPRPASPATWTRAGLRESERH